MSRSSIKDFDVLVKLGSGSFGTVYKVKRIVDNQIYVIKNVKIIELSRREQSDAINEVQILAQLDSPYVVKYFDSFIEKNCLLIVMEFCNRGDLQVLLKKAKEKNVTCLKETVIWNIALQVVLGLQYIHKKKILHRDLKSANVFLTKDANNSNYLVKIGDLGVAKLLETSTALASTIVGTPYYLSPELCADKPYRDKSDCWALGVMLYECCTLQHPFEARNQCALIMKIIQSPVTPPPSTSVSSEMINLVLWLLQKDPDHRPSTRDLLNETVIRNKLMEHKFELPSDLLHSGLLETSHLSYEGSASNDFGTVNTTSGQRGNALRFNEAGEIVNFKSTESATATRERDRGREEVTLVAHEKRDSSSGHRVESATRKLGSSGNNSNEETANIMHPNRGTTVPTYPSRNIAPVRGDRVRGGAAKRVTSDKALTRHQVPRPVNSSSMPSSSAAVGTATPESYESGSDYEGDWLAEEKPPVSGLKAAADRKGQNDSDAKGIALSKEVESAVSEYEEEGFEAYEEGAGGADVKEDVGGIAGIQQRKLGDSQNSRDYDELVGDDDVGIKGRRAGEAKGEEGGPGAVEELSSETNFDFESLLEGIQEAKQQAITTLGEHVFMKVYELCAKSMVQAPGEEGVEKSTSFLEELEKTLSEHAGSDMDMEDACEAVFKIRVLLALESKHDSIIMASSSDHIDRK